MTGRAFLRSKTEAEADERRGASAGPRQAELGVVASTLAPVGPATGRAFLRSKTEAVADERRGYGRGATLERSESVVGQNIGPGGADDRPSVFAKQNGGGSRRAPGCERGTTASGAWRGSEHAGPGACSHSAAFRLRRKRPGRRTRPGRDGCVSDEVYGLLRSGRASRSKALSSCSGAGTWAEAASAFR